MKVFLLFVLVVFSTGCFASYTPLVEISTGYDKTIYVSIINDSGYNLKCKYSVSWFVNALSFRKEFGEVVMPINATTELVYKNDPSSYLTRIKAKAVCK